VNEGSPGTISRRTFLRGGAWIAIAGAASMAIAGTAARALLPGRATTAGERLADVMPHRDSAARVGRAALDAGAVERDVRGLLTGLGEAVPNLADVLRDGSDDDLRAALDDARRRDFAERADGLTRVEGWVVARTEARVCALVALAAPA
jgi:hypothetical protein